MSDKKNENTEVKKTETKPEPKNIRLDRMEENIQLLQEGVLALINLVAWSNETLTPIGTHNTEVSFTNYETLEEALDELAPLPEDGK